MYEESLAALTPRRIVEELSRYIIGQDEAKKMVAIAIRNRWRRLHTPDPIRKEIMPNNIIMIGPTGVGKTEIARRLAQLIKAPFVKVEATKYTEVGYVGRDVESMVRDLMEAGIALVRREMREQVRKKAEEDLAKFLLPKIFPGFNIDNPEFERFKQKLLDGEFDESEVEIEIEEEGPGLPVFGMTIGPEGVVEPPLQFDLPEPLKHLFGGKKVKKRLKVKEAKRILFDRMADKYIDKTRLREIARERVENNGIIFIDEFDKIVGDEEVHGPDVSRTGVQRDLLPIVEGTTVATKYGPVKTDHILFIAAGAFTHASPSDLIPELQGRFPIRVELSPLGEEEFYKILTQTENSLIKQYQALLKTEDVDLLFTKEAIRRIAYYAAQANEKMEDLGARRLHTVMAKILEDILYEIPDRKADQIVITPEFVDSKLSKFIEDEDLSRYIL